MCRLIPCFVFFGQDFMLVLFNRAPAYKAVRIVDEKDNKAYHHRQIPPVNKACCTHMTTAIKRSP